MCPAVELRDTDVEQLLQLGERVFEDEPIAQPDVRIINAIRGLRTECHTIEAVTMIAIEEPVVGEQAINGAAQHVP